MCKADHCFRPLHDHPSRPTRTIREDHSTEGISIMDGQLDQSMGKQKDLHMKWVHMLIHCTKCSAQHDRTHAELDDAEYIES